MRRHEAVVLSYLEWTRLITKGSIWLDESRIVRWMPEAPDHEIVAALMRRTPDGGTKDIAYVQVMLRPEMLDRVKSDGTDLGTWLPIEMVRSFHAFTEYARTIHGHDARKADVEIALSPLSEGWAQWVNTMERFERKRRGETLANLFSLTPDDWSAEWVSEKESLINHDAQAVVKAHDTMYYGWACALNWINERQPLKDLITAEVRAEIQRLAKDYDVAQPFLSTSPILRDFVSGLNHEKELPTDLLAFAALKQHERYVIKRDGAALDVDGLIADVETLKVLDPGSATVLVQNLGERLSGEIIRAVGKLLSDHARSEPPSEPKTVRSPQEQAEFEVLSPEVQPTQRDTNEQETEEKQTSASVAAPISDQERPQIEPHTDAVDSPPTSDPSFCSANHTKPEGFDAEILTAAENVSGEQDSAQSSLFGDSAPPDSKGAPIGKVRGSGSEFPKKYERFNTYLSGLPMEAENPIKLTIVEIEKLVTGGLPPKAKSDRTFWQGNQKHTDAWKSAGFEIDHVEIEPTEGEGKGQVVKSVSFKLVD